MYSESIKDTFKTAGMINWLQLKEMALQFGVGAFEGASAVLAAYGLKVRGRGRLYSIDPHLGAPP